MANSLTASEQIKKAISKQAKVFETTGLPAEVVVLAKEFCSLGRKQLTEVWKKSPRPTDPVMYVLNQLVKDDLSPNPLSEEARKEYREGVGWTPHGDPTDVRVGEGQSRRRASPDVSERFLPRDKLAELAPELFPPVRLAVREVIHHALIVEEGRLQSIEQATTPETPEERSRRRTAVIYDLWSKAEPPITSCENWTNLANEGRLESIDRNTARDYLNGRTAKIHQSSRTALARPLGINPLDMPS